ncbi:MAG: cytochrome d ubiquinol oxidase subunit II [Pseudomonadota bacterium]
MFAMFDDPAVWLPFVFAGLLGISIVLYVILDGFDLGVGVLVPLGDDKEKDMMVASIGPFWDANETWLVLAVGILLVAFPTAHGVILTALYLPVAVMLVGLIMRGVAFEFRAKAPTNRKETWNWIFFAGSLMTSLSQGAMLGLYIMGLVITPATIAFAALTAICLTVGYTYIGATWLILKTQGALQMKSIAWANRALIFVLAGIAAVSLASPLVSERIFAKWFSFPEIVLLAPLPILSAGLLAYMWYVLQRLPDDPDRLDWVPFAASTLLFAIAYAGLAYSFYPYVVPEKLTIYEAASAPESLMIILVGACVVVPTILGYTVLSYWIFRGKATELRYD